jgi:arsenite methyltransferase
MPILHVLILVAFMSAFFYALARQLARPSGWFGRAVMTPFLNYGNRSMIDAAVTALGPKTGERIVDVGFGGGYALQSIAPRVMPARATGVEVSDAMIDAARIRWREAIEVYRADAAAMPFPNGSFDGIISVNTIYFWSDPAAVLREFRRILQPGGRLVLGIGMKEVMRWSPVTWFGFRLYSANEIESMLDAAGFEASIQRAGLGELIVLARPKACSPANLHDST